MTQIALMGLFHWACLVGNYGFFAGQEQSLESVRMGCIFYACPGGSPKISNMFDISLTLPDSVSGPWLHPPGNCPVVGLYSLLDILPVLSYTCYKYRYCTGALFDLSITCVC